MSIETIHGPLNLEFDWMMQLPFIRLFYNGWITWKFFKVYSQQKQNGEDRFEELKLFFRIQNIQLYSRITNAFVLILECTKCFHAFDNDMDLGNIFYKDIFVRNSFSMDQVKYPEDLISVFSHNVSSMYNVSVITSFIAGTNH